MIKMLTYVESLSTSPYENLAMEEYLLFHCLEDECILYLWQNEKTVVIGKNQNAWKECFVSRLEDDGGNLVRRLSGGGTVYHDLGNLNFTFITRSKNYDVKRQTEIIVNAINKLGIQATCSGRNDILVDGKFAEELKDNNLHWKGSSNQHVIDVKKSLVTGEMVIYG